MLLPLVGGITYYFQQRAERERQRIEQTAAVERVVGHAVTLHDQALAHPEDVSRWQVALVAVQQSEVGDDAAARDRGLSWPRGRYAQTTIEAPHFIKGFNR